MIGRAPRAAVTLIGGAIIGSPASSWRTLARSDRIRVPSPAARIIAASFASLPFLVGIGSQSYSLKLEIRHAPASLRAVIIQNLSKEPPSGTSIRALNRNVT